MDCNTYGQTQEKPIFKEKEQEQFFKKIKEVQDNLNDVFYNTEGSSNAYKNFIRHLSSAEDFGYGHIINGDLYTEKEFYLANLDKLSLKKVEIGDVVEVIPLKFLD